jgi:Raf kinase inhibitor-like YbhB/YbcL family protein
MEVLMAEPHLTFAIFSPAFENEQPIPKKFTCDGENISPILTWANTPPETQSLALIVEDPDASIGTWTHWILYNLSSSLTRLPEHIANLEQVGGVGAQGLNTGSKIGYSGPCPSPGKRHRYYFYLYALDIPPTLPAKLNAAQLLGKMNGHIIAKIETMGTYIRA